MFNRNLMLVLTLLFTVFIVAACSSQNGKSDGDDNTSETEDVESDTDKEVSDDVEDEQTNEDAASDDDEEVLETESDQSSNTSAELPKTIEINDREQTDTGLIFELERITFEEDHIAVDFNADNMSGYKKTLASKGVAKNTDLGGITLQDDTGFDYRYVAELEDARIVLHDQEKVEGTVRFLGRIQDDAKTLTLIFNVGITEPHFEYENIEIEW